jgi:hypothetical protein
VAIGPTGMTDLQNASGPPGHRVPMVHRIRHLGNNNHPTLFNNLSFAPGERVK